MGGWYSKPQDGEAYKQFSENPNQKQIFKFHLKKGEKKDVIFLADECFTVWEATLKLGDRFETFTSTKDENCPLVKAGIRLTQAQYCSVLDMTPYDSKKDGTKKQYSRKAMRIAGTSIDKIDRRRKEVGGSLVGYKMTCYRDGDKDPGCGSDFTIHPTKVDLNKVPKEDAKLMDFEDLLKPLPASILEAKIRASSQGSKTYSRDDITTPGNPFDQTASTAPEAAPADDIPF